MNLVTVGCSASAVGTQKQSQSREEKETGVQTESLEEKEIPSMLPPCFPRALRSPLPISPEAQLYF